MTCPMLLCAAASRVETRLCSHWCVETEEETEFPPQLWFLLTASSLLKTFPQTPAAALQEKQFWGLSTAPLHDPGGAAKHANSQCTQTLRDKLKFC